MPKYQKSHWLRWFSISFVLIVFDQISKQWAVNHLPLRESITLLPGLVFYLCYNSGMSFSLLANKSTFLILITSVLLLSIIRDLYRSHQYNDSRYTSFGLSCILGGGLGNLYDRFTIGAVVDFITIQMLGFKTPVFNVADLFISVGALLMIIPWVISIKHQNN